jgi:hypothetical protein
MKTLWMRCVVAATLTSGATLAQAVPIVNLTGWTFGSPNTVHVTSPSHDGSAGGFKGSISGFGAAFDDATFETYCVELTQHFNLPSGNMTGYVIVPGSSYAEWTLPGTPNRIGQLITYVNAHPTAVDTAGESTSLQLAIWNSIYDTDNTLTTGAFKDTSAFATYANTLLANSAATVSNLNVYVLMNREKQDFLVTTPVPEPETYALMMAGLMAVGFVARRSRARQR